MHLHISLVAEKLFTLGGVIPVTNSLLMSWIVMAILLIFTFFATRKISLVPGYLQSIAEILIDSLHSLFESVLHEKTDKFFTLLATLFILILTMNWAGLFPGVGTVGFFKGIGAHQEFTPLLRSGSADLNFTLALALLVMVTIQFYGFKTLGFSYIKRFINFKGPIDFYVGILELVSEISKVISFAFRLFGNIFAGEVLLAVIAFLIPLLAPLPFLGLELFVGFIQALVFSLLTAAFMAVATASHAEH